MAGPYGVDDAALTYGGSAIGGYCTKAHLSIDEQNQTEEHTPEGATIVQQMFTGLTDYGEMSVGGPYTTEMDAIIGAASRAKSYAALVRTWGGTKTSTLSQVGVKGYKRQVEGGAVTSFEATFFCGPACTMTEA